MGLHRLFAASVILSIGDWIKVAGIHARVDSTEVIEVQPRWNRTYQALVHGPVRPLGPTKPPITGRLVDPALP